MRTSAPRLSALFRSDTQAEILARVILNPDHQYSVSDLSRIVGAAYATTHREVQRLVDLGLFTQQQVGRALLISANESDPAYTHVAGLLRLSYGPTSVLPSVLAGISGIEEAFIYGSWAARRAGEPGPPPGDVDVLVVGDPPRSEIYDAAQQAEQRLGREVNIRVTSTAAWHEATDPFLRTLRERPLTALELEERA